jgi:hypothetical protein
MEFQAQADLCNYGFCVVSDVIGRETCQKILSLLRGRPYTSIFRDPGLLSDPDRATTKLNRNDPGLVHVLRSLQDLIHRFERRWHAFSWYAIKSNAGGGEQAFHQDYVPDTLFQDYTEFGSFPGSCLLALQDGTSLNLIPTDSWRSQFFKDEVRTLHLKAGQMVIFKGYVAHGGAKYTRENIRLFAYLVFKQRDDDIMNHTSFVILSSRLLKCNRCAEAFSTKQLLNDHKAFVHGDHSGTLKLLMNNKE